MKLQSERVTVIKFGPNPSEWKEPYTQHVLMALEQLSWVNHFFVGLTLPQYIKTSATLDRTHQKRSGDGADGEELKSILESSRSVGGTSLAFLAEPVKGKPLRGGCACLRIRI